MATFRLLACVCVWASALGCGAALRCELRVFRGPDAPAVLETYPADVAAPPDEVLDPAYFRARRRPDAPRHLVFLTHGLETSGIPDKWLEDCKNRIFRRVGKADPDLRVIVFDWAAASTGGLQEGFVFRRPNTMRPYLTMSAQAAAKLLADGGHLHSDPAAQHIHLIGHSRGAALVSYLARVLTEGGVPIDHITYLDGLDTLEPHADLERVNDPPLRCDLAAFCDSYYCDGFFYGLLDFDNYFVAGARRRDASMNVHFKHLTHVESHDLYMESIDDPAIPWGWQWAAPGGFDVGRRNPLTYEIELPRLIIEGPVAAMGDVVHEVWRRRTEESRRRLFLSGTGQAARYLRPGIYEVTFRDRRTGRELPLSHEIVRHTFGAGPGADRRATVTGDDRGTVRVKLRNIGEDHVFRVARE